MEEWITGTRVRGDVPKGPIEGDRSKAQSAPMKVNLTRFTDDRLYKDALLNPSKTSSPGIGGNGVNFGEFPQTWDNVEELMALQLQDIYDREEAIKGPIAPARPNKGEVSQEWVELNPIVYEGVGGGG
ncbi:hypothetical protein V6N12_031149 [Hibiscus sabdariffa]|uniref:Uncharacterized protein n=1 Tax=Hibiscus sabdariffa TaxID=183260 RepID=A0ABR2E9Y0_9ROSI